MGKVLRELLHENIAFKYCMKILPQKLVIKYKGIIANLFVASK